MVGHTGRGRHQAGTVVEHTGRVEPTQHVNNLRHFWHSQPFSIEKKLNVYIYVLLQGIIILRLMD